MGRDSVRGMSAASVARPVTEQYDDVVAETVTVTAPDGYAGPALLYRPVGPGPHPGIAIGMEATGINHFIRDVAATLAHLGFVTIVPDYYRGTGPADTENYDDIDAIMSHTLALDFPRAARDLIASADWLRAHPDVDGDRVGYWGYCTGATVVLLAAELDRLAAAGVFFYPSQPWFTDLGPGRPAHPMDLLWLLTGPTLIVYGDDDIIMSAEQLDSVRAGLASSGVDGEVRVYAGAGHAFSAPSPAFYNEAADLASWPDAVAFLQRTLT
jgi:carboxymethylenebutenolidase